MTLPSLQHRRATDADRETLLAMRKSCGWGTERIDSYISEPSWVTYLFFRPTEDSKGEEPVGMGCLVFDIPGDPTMANREDGIIAISEFRACVRREVHQKEDESYQKSCSCDVFFATASLFVFPQYRASGVGNQTFTMLEQLAIREYGAKTLAVDTRAYEIPWASEGETSYLKKWYERRGYVEYRVSLIFSRARCKIPSLVNQATKRISS